MSEFCVLDPEVEPDLQSAGPVAGAAETGSPVGISFGWFMITGLGLVLGATGVVKLVQHLASRPHPKHPAPGHTAVADTARSAAHVTSSVSGLTLGLGVAAFVAAAVLVVAGVVTVKRVRRAKRARLAARASWAALLAQHDELEARWLSYEKDLRLLVQYPAMRDMADPLVQDVVRAMAAASRLRQAIPPRAGAAAQRPLEDAVDALRSALDTAEHYARKVRRSKFSDTERTTLRRAQALLDKAMDEGNFVPERQAAYRQALKLLEGLIVVPPSAVRAMLAAHPILAIEPPAPVIDPLAGPCSAGLSPASIPA